ncbi:MAG: hypothetical protein ACYTBV_08380 [Planctomycetota bacterium]
MKIFAVLDRKENRKHVQPIVDFPVLMEYILKEAKEKHGERVDVPEF